MVFLTNLDLILATVALIAALLGGGLLLYWVRHWRKQTRMPPTSPTDDLASFRALYEQGKLSRAEFDCIVQAIAQRAAEQAREQAEEEG